jgi:hypothetical protein
VLFGESGEQQDGSFSRAKGEGRKYPVEWRGPIQYGSIGNSGSSPFAQEGGSSCGTGFG